METFAPGDRVVAINTDLSGPINDPSGSPMSAFLFPDGQLRKDVIYHVRLIQSLTTGHQGLFLTGLRVILHNHQIPWDSSRFRKVDTLKGHTPRKRRRKQPVAAAPRAICSVS
jgi:hypothetical protein